MPIESEKSTHVSFNWIFRTILIPLRGGTKKVLNRINKSYKYSINFYNYSIILMV